MTSFKRKEDCCVEQRVDNAQMALELKGHAPHLHSFELGEVDVHWQCAILVADEGGRHRHTPWGLHPRQPRHTTIALGDRPSGPTRGSQDDVPLEFVGASKRKLSHHNESKAKQNESKVPGMRTGICIETTRRTLFPLSPCFATGE